MPAKSKPSTLAFPRALRLSRHLVLPSLTILVLCLAGSAVTRATIGSPTSTGVAVSTTPAAVPLANPALETFCEHNWGELSDDGTLCRFSQRFHLNLGHVGSSVVVTNIPVVPLDTISIQATTPPDLIVGDETYGLGGESIQVATGGYLSFRAAAGQAIFSVQRVNLERCYAWNGSAVDTAACGER